jgi:hypothetical protein
VCICYGWTQDDGVAKRVARECAWWRSRETTTKGFDVEKISNTSFCFVIRGGSYGSEVFRSLS